MTHAREPESAADAPVEAKRRRVEPGGNPAVLLRLQRGAGNAAVTGLVRRQSGPRPVALPKPRGTQSTVTTTATTDITEPQPASDPPVPEPATAAPTLDNGGGPADAPAEPPAPGLGDEELATLDQPAGPAVQPVSDDPPAGPVIQTVPGEAAADPVVQRVPDGDAAGGPVVQTASGDQADAAQADVAATAQAEVDSIGADAGPEPEAGGGGGGGGVIEEQPPPPPPNVAAAPPEQAMAQLGSLRPGQMLATVATVEAAASGAVAREQGKLAAAPPQHTPLAATTTVATPASALVPGAATHTAKVDRVPEKSAHPLPAPKPVPAAGPPATGRVPAPALPVTPQDGLNEAAARDLSTSLDRLPARDPGTVVPTAPAPHVPLTGEADPGQVAAQQARLAQGTAQAQAEGGRDAAEPLGEDAVHPTTPVETMSADVPTAPTAEPAPAPAEAEGVDEAVSAVAEEQQGPQLRAAAASASSAMAGERRRHAEQETAQRRQSADQIAGLEREHAEAEQAERSGVRAEVAAQRAQWRSEQHTMVTGAHAEAQNVVGTAGETIENERQRADTEAAAHHQQGQQEAAEARREGEQEAARHRGEARQESGGGGFFGWIASRAQALFDRVKQGITAAFEKARQAVRAAVEKAQQLATAVIERARQVAVAAIRLAGSALTAIGDRLLAGFPALRDRFRNAVQARVRQAEAAVNRLAEGLKSGVRAALGLLGRGLSALLSGLEAGLKAAVDGVAATVRGAINAARSALQALGAFMAIARDVAANPGAWLRNLGAAVMDGIRNHLWVALKAAVQQWFNDKVEQVLGLGRTVWNLLTRGGISLARIGQMAWEGIKQAIPAALIAILIEKLASMIIPAAGAVLAIIQGLRAAWGAVSRVLAAIDRFIAFLRAVKSGNGGQAFATAVAAAAVTVVDFVSNWLLARIARGASRIGNRIRAIAQRIGAALRRVATRVGGAVRRLGQRIGNRVRGLRDRFQAGRDRRRGISPEERRRRDAADKQRRLDAARTAVHNALQRGISGLRLRALLAFLKIRHRLRELRVEDQGRNRARIVGAVNPSFEEHAEKTEVVPPDSPERSRKAVQSFWRSMSLAELKNIAAGRGFSVKVSKGRATGEPGLSDRAVYATHHIQKDKTQPDPAKYDYAVLVEFQLEEGAMADLMHGPNAMIAKVTADQLSLRGQGQIVQKTVRGRLRDVFVFHDKPAHLPKELPIHEKGQRNALVYKIERVRGQANEEAENYLVLSVRADDPDALVHQLNARIVRVLVTGGVAGQVTSGLVQGLLGGAGGGSGSGT
ncbi:hypothetical protein [Saccharothrix deserti]|uniref:hypothetical protein n=1 Tax=Saccharothrix deserti TaxID=2593674 RepID=UPI00131B7145|nr:hypothetical protein [Saccharothrix deserti]